MSMFLSLIFYLGALISIEAAKIENICRSEACKKSAQNLKACMNETINPCENFYQYACGNFVSLLNEQNTANDYFSFGQQKISKFVEKILEDEEKYPSKAVETAKQFYRSCLDIVSMNEKGLAPLNEIFRRVGLTTKSPLSHPTKGFDWVSVAAKLKKYLNLNFLIAVDVTADSKNRTLNRISVSKPSDYTASGPTYSEYLKSPFKRRLRKKRKSKAGSQAESEKPGEDLYTYIKGASNVFDRSTKKKNNSQKRKLKQAINNLVALVSERKNLHNKNRPDEIRVPKLLTLNELQTYTDSATVGLFDGKFVLDWKKYITILFKDSNVNLNLDEGIDKISVSDMLYLKDAVLFVESKHRILESALWWDVIQNFGPFTIDELRELDFTYRENELYYSGDGTDLCQGVVRKYFSFALAHTFLNDSEVTEYQHRTKEMMDNIRHGFDDVVRMANWMDNKTKAVAHEKSTNMRMYVSHPQWLYNVTKVDEYFEEDKVYSKDFLHTVVSFEQEIVKQNLQSLRNLNDLSEESYDSYPLVTNAFYSSSDNSMSVPMGIVQFPFVGHPIQALNYGSLGSIIGHEITHGFDTEGKMYDPIGNIRRWWKNETLSEYRKRAACFIESYNKIEIGGENVDGILTLDENIADNGGLRESLIAYRHYVKTNGVEPLLEGFERFTHEQLFVLSFANIWCSVSSTVSSTDKHSPNEARVLGVLKNSNDFQDIWKCEKGNPMNPANKCQIW